MIVAGGSPPCAGAAVGTGVKASELPWDLGEAPGRNFSAGKEDMQAKGTKASPPLVTSGRARAERREGAR